MGAFYLFSGNEDFSIKDRTGEFIRGLCGEIPEDNTALEIIRGDTENEKAHVVLRKLLAALETPSFLEPRKIIWLKHFNKFDEAAAEPSTKKKPSCLDLLSDFLKKGIPEDTTLVIDGPLDRRKAFYKLCEKVCQSSGGKLEWFEKADVKSKGYMANLTHRIKEMALNSGDKRINDDAAAFLAETAGADAPRLKNEIDKLIAYVGEQRVITLQDCCNICSRNAETLSWEFASALAERNASKALELIPGLIETMEQERGGSSRPEIAISAAAHAEFQRLLAIRCDGQKFHLPENATPDDFYALSARKDELPESPLLSMHPYRAFKTWENAARFSSYDFVCAFQAILDASLSMVTGGDARMALEKLVMIIAGERR